MKRLVVLACVCGVVLGAVTLLAADRQKPAEKIAIEGVDNPPMDHASPAVRTLETAVQTKAPKSRVVGTIAYDLGTVTATPGAQSFCYGNQFNTAAGVPVNASGSITQVNFFMISGAGSDNVFFSVFGPVSGTVAPVLTSTSIPAPNSNGWNTYTFASPITYTGPSFLAGVWAYGSGDSVGLGSGTAAGQGYHAMVINDVSGNSFATIPSLNALVRASGNVLVPVELMSLSVN